MPLNHLLRPLLIALSLSTLPLTGSWAETGVGSPSELEQGPLPLEELRTFTKVYEHIRQGYVEELDDKTLLEYAIKGMLSELDPHSSYLNAALFDDLQVNTTGEFGGLGIEVGMENGFIKVIAPIDSTPAAKAGVEAGDLIIKLDETPVKGLNLGEAVDLMRGPKGSDIIITIVREGIEQPFELTITRDIIKVDSVRTRFVEEDYAYLRIAQFQVNTGEEIQTAVKQMVRDNPDMKGVILDLRNNPGGVLQASVKVADTFLQEGLIVYTEGRIANTDISFEATPGDLTHGLPLVVLINGGSASASEIVAGALQDQKRAIIMGTQSFGKGSVQTVIPLTDESAIKLTTALYFTPNGRSIQAQGIVPDIEVERAKVTSLRPKSMMTEADLDGHLNNANGGEDIGSKTRDEDKKTTENLLEKDNQMFEALSLLKGIHLFAQNRAEMKTPDKQDPLPSATPSDITP